MDAVDWAVLLFFISAILLVTLVNRYLKNHFKYWERRRIPHLRPVIPKGNMEQWLHSKHSAEIFNETYDCYKHRELIFAGFYFNTQIAAMVLDLELVKAVLSSHFNSFERRGLFHNEKDEPLTGNLFLLDGPKWKMLRSKLTPTFAGGKMKYIFPTMLSVGDELLKVFDDQIIETENGIFNVTSILRQFSCDVIGNCVYGLNCESMKDPEVRFSVMAQEFFKTRRHPALIDSLINCFPERAKSLGMKVIPQDISDYFMRLGTDAIKYREKFNVKKADYLDVLMELNRSGDVRLTTEELSVQAFVFLITAFDTCSSTLSCALFELAQHPDIQNRLRQEINKTLKTHKNKLTYECLKEMRYLDQVISETLRKYPPIPALFRKCTKNFILSNRPLYYIEKGCLVIIPIFSIHHDDKYFPNPYNFNPDRFSPANISNIKPYSYLPFGDGQRSCIGARFGRMQTSIGLLKLITNYNFEVCSKTKKPLKFVIQTFNVSPTFVTLKVTKV